MSLLSRHLAERARRAAKETRNSYTLTDWLWALNLEAGRDSERLREAALILREMKPFLTPHNDT